MEDLIRRENAIREFEAWTDLTQEETEFKEAVIETLEMIPAEDEDKEIKELRELAARILLKYEAEKMKSLAAVRLSALSGTERERAKEMQARTVKEIEDLRKEIKGK